MQPIDPIIGRQVVEAWANYQAFADADRARHLRAMTDEDTRHEVAMLFDSPLRCETKSESGLAEMQRIFRRARAC